MNFKNAITDPNHYINQVIWYFEGMTDSILDIHEAYAFLHLSCACRKLRWKFNPALKSGERLNMYFVFLGESGSAKKSTVMGVHRDLLDGVFRLPAFFRAQSFTPQGLRDGLAEREGVATVIQFDEMEDIFRAMATPGSNMGGLPMMLKELFSGPEFTTKLSKVGKSRMDQEVVIEDSYVCLMGNVTPTIGTAFEERYLTDGLVARINIIKASHSPREMTPFDWEERYKGFVLDAGGELMTKRAIIEKGLKEHLMGIERSLEYLSDDELVVNMPMDVLKLLKTFDVKIRTLVSSLSEGDVGIPSYTRLKNTVYKCASLIAAGRMGGDEIEAARGVTVTIEDARDAMRFCTKMLKNSQEFVSLCSSTKEQKNLDYVLKRTKSILPKFKNKIPGREVARACRNKLVAGVVDQVLPQLVRIGELSVTVSGGIDVYSVPAATVTAELVPPEDDDAERTAAEVPN